MKWISGYRGKCMYHRFADTTVVKEVLCGRNMFILIVLSYIYLNITDADALRTDLIN